MSAARPTARLLAAKGALEVARGRRPSRRGARPFAAALTALVLLATVAALGAGTAVYRSVHGSGASDDAARLSSALVANTVRAQDRAYVLGTADGPEGPALVLSSHLPSGDYETRIYLSGGSVVRELALAGSPLNPASATEVVPSSTFSFSLDGGLLTVETDGGTCSVALRAPQGPVGGGAS